MARKYKLNSEVETTFSIDYSRELDLQQFEAVTSANGPTLVIAGAGSGKTRTITYRVARLIESGVPPEKILLVTFTNKAAREMLRRLEQLLRIDMRQFWGGTFHSIGNRILRKHAALLDYQPNYTILDSEDAKDLMSAVLDDAGSLVTEERFPKAEVLRDIISMSVNTQSPVPQIVRDRFSFFSSRADDICAVANRYEIRKRKSNAMDYDDLLFNWLRLLTEDKMAREFWADKFNHVLVDEYQDTNSLQGLIIDLLSSQHRNVMVVGDDAQSIYQWRGASFENIYHFPERYAGAKIYRIETNYRSTPEILNLANHSIANNKKQFPKTLVANRKSIGILPALVPLKDADEQAKFVATRILELRNDGIPLNEIAVLYRSHWHSMQLELELVRRNIPYEVRSGLKFLEQAHIKDVLAYLKIDINRQDELAWKRILNLIPRVGKAKAQKLWDAISISNEPVKALAATGSSLKLDGDYWTKFLQLIKQLLDNDAEAGKSPAHKIELVLSSSYQDHLLEKYDNARFRIEDINQLANFAVRFESTEGLLSEIALVGTEHGRRGQEKRLTALDAFQADVEEDPLVLSSIHQAKGLEWKAVFLLWVAEGSFPSTLALKRDYGEEEERRLFYVTVTRAKDQVYLCYPLRSQSYSDDEILHRPSRFIAELPENLYEKWEICS